MNTYIITYDVDTEHQDLYDAIKSYGTWAHINESVWAVASVKSAKEIRDHLKSQLTSDDSLFVVKSGTEAAWSNVMCSNEWLKNYL